jgi:hypothetical protein
MKKEAHRSETIGKLHPITKDSFQTDGETKEFHLKFPATRILAVKISSLIISPSEYIHDKEKASIKFRAAPQLDFEVIYEQNWQRLE